MASQYPGALDTTNTLFIATNGLQTALTGFHSSSTNVINVKDTTGAPSSGYATIEGEAVFYTGKTSTSLTGCTRHADGTAASTHQDKAIVKFGLVADHHNSLVQAVIALETRLGINGATFNGANILAASVTQDKLSNPYKARGANTVAQAILALTPTKVVFGNNSSAGCYTDGNFSLVNSRYTAAVAGKYSVKAVVPFRTNAAQRRVIVMIYKNGAEYSRTCGNSVANQAINQPIPDDVQLAVNDYLEIWAWSSVADTLEFNGNPGDYASFAISLMP